jgi:hypothetical protein
MSEILATWEAKIRMIGFEASPDKKKVRPTSKISIKKGLEVHLK